MQFQPPSVIHTQDMDPALSITSSPNEYIRTARAQSHHTVFAVCSCDFIGPEEASNKDLVILDHWMTEHANLTVRNCSIHEALFLHNVAELSRHIFL